MKLSFRAVVVFWLSFALFLNAAEPNYVKTTDVGVGTDTNGNKTDRISISFSDGLGRSLQSKSNLSAIISGNDPSDTTRFLTGCTFYDDAGRPEITTKPFINNSVNYLQDSFSVIKTYLNNCYNQFTGNSEGDRIAYSKTTYYSDPLSRVYESSIPGVNNSIESGNTARQWLFGVGKASVSINCNSGASIVLQDGFIKGKSDNSVLTVSDLDSLYNYLLENQSAFSDSTKYLLTVTKDAGGKYSQILKDAFGRAVGTASMISGNSGVIVTSSTYDILGNLLEQTPPSNGTKNISSTKYLYNTLGQMIRKETPDRAVDSFVYNKAGLLDTSFSIVYSSDGQSTIVRTLVYDYDAFQRVTNVWAPHYMGATVLMENYYDGVDDLITAGKERYKMPVNFLDSIENCKGKLVASVGNGYLNRKWYYAVDVYSYDEDGNVSCKYKFVSGLPLQKTTFTYDVHGRKTSEKVEIAGNSHTRSYSYDELGRLSNIKTGDKVLASYTYDSLGRLDKKYLGSSLASSYQYTINEQVANLNNLVSGSTRFNETLGYRPDGNITSATFGYGGFTNAPSSITQEYSYDTLNRLVTVNSGTAIYQCSYAYDTIGRFTSKIEGTSTISGYDYYDSTNRLSKAKQSSNDYFYDAFGNLVLDKKKKMVIEYNWRDLPVRFSFYNTIPDSITASINGTLKTSEDSTAVYYSSSVATYMQTLTTQNTGVRLLSTVSMVYDAGGNRVLKMESGL